MSGVITRRQAEEMAWEAWVGSQTPEEFMAASGDELIDQAVSEYIRDFPFMFDDYKPCDPKALLFPEENLEPPFWRWEDLHGLLAGYIRRCLEERS